MKHVLGWVLILIGMFSTFQAASLVTVITLGHHDHSSQGQPVLIFLLAEDVTLFLIWGGIVGLALDFARRRRKVLSIALVYVGIAAIFCIESVSALVLLPSGSNYINFMLILGGLSLIFLIGLFPLVGGILLLRK